MGQLSSPGRVLGPARGLEDRRSLLVSWEAPGFASGASKEVIQALSSCQKLFIFRGLPEAHVQPAPWWGERDQLLGSAAWGLKGGLTKYPYRAWGRAWPAGRRWHEGFLCWRGTAGRCHCSVPFPFSPLLSLPRAQGEGERRAGGCGSCRFALSGRGKVSTCLILSLFAVSADSAHVYFIRRGGCLVSLSSDVISAPRAGPAVLSLMNSAVAPRSPPRYQSSRCQIKPGLGKESESKAKEEAGRGEKGGSGCCRGSPGAGLSLFPAGFSV